MSGPRKLQELVLDYFSLYQVNPGQPGIDRDVCAYAEDGASKTDLIVDSLAKGSDRKLVRDYVRDAF